MKNRIPSIIIAIVLVIACVLAVVRRPAAYYPLIKVETVSPLDDGKNVGKATRGEQFGLTFLFDAHSALTSCEALTGNVARVTLAQCPTCTISQLQCLSELTPPQQEILSDRPVSEPSGRMANGVVIYSSSTSEGAMRACLETQSKSENSAHPVTCHAANSLRPKPASSHISNGQLGYGLLTFAAAILGAFLVCWLIIKYEHLHAHLSHDHTNTGPQKFHAEPTPRIGGLGLAGGLGAAGSIMIGINQLPYEHEFGLLMLASIPAFFGGLVEDVTKKVGVLERLLLTMLSGAIAAWLLGATLNRVDISVFDKALLWLPFSVALTCFAVGGIANAVNIIDGYNGLAAGYAAIVAGAIAVVAGWIGDMLVFPVALSMAGALLGFLVWNWPRGKIFLGDGGAYLLGFILAELAILIVVRNQEVSPWFPLLLLIYPVFETLFSIYRKKFIRGNSPGKPDGLHLHMLIYKRIVPRRTQFGVTLTKLNRNNRVAKYVWAVTVLIAFVGIALWNSTDKLMVATLACCGFYLLSYRRIFPKRGRFVRLR